MIDHDSRQDLTDPNIYPNAQAHLLDEFRWLNRLLAAHVLRLRRVNFYEGLKDFRGFFIDEQEVDALLAAGVFEADGKVDDNEGAGQIEELLAQASRIRTEIANRVQQSLARDVYLPLAHLGQCFHLNEFELQVLVICVAPEIDARYEKLYAYLQNDLNRRFASIDLILSLLCPDPEERLHSLAYFHPAAPMKHFGLLESPETEAPAAQHALRVDPRVVHHLLGNQAIDQRVRPHLRFYPPLRWQDVVVDAEFRQRVQQLLDLAAGSESDYRPILYLSGRSGIGKKTLARTLCGDLGMALGVVDVRSLLQPLESFRERIRLILREGLLQPCAIYLDHMEEFESFARETPSIWPVLIEEIHELGWITFLGSENPAPTELLDLWAICPIEVSAQDHAAQTALWQKHLDGTLSKNELRSLDQLARRFDLTAGQIGYAARRAKLAALVRNPKAPAVTFSDLFAGSRVQSQPKLSTLARKIEPKHQWNDLVLPDDQMRQLRELSHQVKNRHVVMEEWGFADKLSLGQGLNALFAGPSGTGKTMAAEIIAHDLALDLFKIDLSAVVSKYIGETEKNLNRIFSEAENSSAILFFDEADALLGKRSEVKDAHDRYANIEIAYLLQKMEEYQGITILATNFRRNIDAAFTRRIRFIIEFPFPEEEHRLRIWQGIWPKGTPLGEEVDLAFMARQFKMAGGSIRNIALASAFNAANNGKAVDMKHLMHATKREFQKMGKLCVKAEFGEYYELLEPGEALD